MENKEITNQKDNKEIIRNAMKTLSSIVGKTLGPGGLPILIQREGLDAVHRPLEPLVTKDGVTVAKSIKVKDNKLNAVIQTVIEIARRTNEEVGDGTTSSIVLANSLYEEGLKYIALGDRPEEVSRQINNVKEEIIEELGRIAIKGNTVGFIESVATTSSNNNKEIGVIVARAFSGVGEDGVITLEEGYGSEDKLRVENGFQIDRGSIRPGLFFNRQKDEESVLQNCAIILYDGELTDPNDIAPIISEITEQGTNQNAFLIISTDVGGLALNMLATNRSEGIFTNIEVIKSPHVGHVRTAMLNDISIATGTKVFTPDESGNGTQLRKARLIELGFARKIVVTKYKTVIYGGGGKDSEVIERTDHLKASLTRVESPYDAQILKNRVASLVGGIAVIEVGGKTELEMKERKDRIEDALNATRAAIQEGIVAGGGSALLYIGTILKGKTIGHKIMRKVSESIIRQILSNVGENSDLIIEKIKEKISQENIIGYNGTSKKIENLIEAKIIDPVKVVKSSLLNAISITNLLLTCGGSITIDCQSNKLTDINNNSMSF